MKIEQSGASSLAGTSRTEQTTSISGIHGGRGKHESGDQVRLSSFSGSVSAEASNSSQRTSHVAHVGRLVSTGQYSVNADAVSNSLIQHAMAA